MTDQTQSDATKKLEAISALTNNKDYKFNFRKDAETGTKRPSMTLALPVPTLDGLVVALEDEKQRQWVLDLIGSAVFAAAKEQINDSVRPVSKQEELRTDELSIAFLANIPASDRRGSAIPAEDWQAFVKDYVEIMPALINKTVQQVTTQATLFAKKLVPVKTNKEVLARLRDNFNIYMANSTQLEEFGDLVEYLATKLENLIGAEEIDWADQI